MKTVIVIPARYASSRLPGKPLLRETGKYLVQHVYERACQARRATSVVVATDDSRIVAAVRGFGGTVAMTRRDHPTGTDRVAEVARGVDADVIVNLQGDEPLIDPRAIDELIAPFLANPSVQMTTLFRRIQDPSELNNPNVTKVVVDRGGFALYFSRAPIPFVRDPRGGWPPFYRHIGLYAYRRSTLLVLASLDPTPLERAESLEQLRALEHGIRIKAVETLYESFGVDTPEDLEQVRRLLTAPTSS